MDFSIMPGVHPKNRSLPPTTTGFYYTSPKTRLFTEERRKEFGKRFIETVLSGGRIDVVPRRISWKN